jgi:hypothetical protein
MAAAGTKEHNLIVNFTFNPPLIYIIGPVRDTTVQKLNAILPEVCTSTQTSNPKNKFEFQRIERPGGAVWKGQLHHSFANEEVGQSRLVLALMDSMEEEGDWKLKGSNATCHDVDKVTYKFFFVRKI